MALIDVTPAMLRFSDRVPGAGQPMPLVLTDPAYERDLIAWVLEHLDQACPPGEPINGPALVEYVAYCWDCATEDAARFVDWALAG